MYSATTLRRRRDEWISLGVMVELREMVLDAYDRIIGLQLADISVDCCITKAPCGNEKAGKSPVDRGKQGTKRSMVVEADGIPLGAITAPANRHDSPLLSENSGHPEGIVGPTPEQVRVHLDRGYDSEATRERLETSSLTPMISEKARRLRCKPRSGGSWSAQTPGTTPTRNSCGVPNGVDGSSISESPSPRRSSS